ERDLIDLGASPEDASAFALQAVSEWLRLGYAAPTGAAAEIAGPPSCLRRLEIGPLSVEVALHGDDGLQAMWDVFGHLETHDPSTGEPPPRIAAVRRDDFDFIFVDGRPAGMTEPHQSAPLLKVVLTELYSAALVDGFVAHGALLSAGGKSVLLAGEPGA